MMIFRLIVLLPVCILSSCATVTTGTSQTVTIETEPPGAVCRMTRGDETVGVVNPTPGSVTIAKDKDEIEISCGLSGYQTTSQKLDSDFQGMTLGNVLLGGIVGIAIDAGSGAMHEYPASITVRLIPEQFSDSDERDQYFDNLVAELNAKTEQVAESRNYSCNTRRCKERMEKLINERDAELVVIESARKDARLQTN